MEPTLDPSDWDAFRALAHSALDAALDYQQSLNDRPAWQPLPAEVRAALQEPLPRDGIGAEAAVETFLKHVLPYPNGNNHPRFFGWVQGSGTPLGMLAEMLVAAQNPHLAGFDQAPALVEQQTVRWLAESLGFPAEASGVLVTGGTFANVLGLVVARHARAGFDVRAEGLKGGPQLTVYGSEETHGWVQKALELMGIGRAGWRPVPVDDRYRIRLHDLETALAADRAAGHRPVCVIGTAGTVNTGAVDDLDGLADLCSAHDLWFHVDGAFGALAAWSPAHAPLVRGLERADSVAFDLHKWPSLPFEVACVLVRDPAVHRAAFATSPAYLKPSERGVIAGGLPFANLGVDLTRGFKALKVWMTLKAEGLDRLGRVVGKNIEQAQHLARVVETADDLELLAPAPLNVVGFRATAPGLDEAALDALNEETLLRVQESGEAVLSSTTLQGRYALRAALVGQRTTTPDVDRLVASVRHNAAAVLAEGGP